MIFETLSVIPSVFEPYVDASVMGRARKAGVFLYVSHDLRDWTHDKHKTVDDAPFGGGAGMLMKAPPIFEAVEDLSGQGEIRPHVVFFSPVGKLFSHKDAVRLSKLERILFVCGRYEGIDERAYTLADEIFCMGDFVISGGELAALTVMDAVFRQIPGALGDEMSAQDESFATGLLEYAQYTRPADFRGMQVPDVLLSGNHAEVDAWRAHSAYERTKMYRPDLLGSCVFHEGDHE